MLLFLNNLILNVLYHRYSAEEKKKTFCDVLNKIKKLNLD